MSAHISPAPGTRTRPLAARPIINAARSAWRRLHHAYKVALREETSRRNLHVLDDRMLADIGISRTQANFEADRKPWHRI